MLPLPPECKSGALLIELHPHKEDKNITFILVLIYNLVYKIICIVEPAALYTLLVGFFLGPVTRFHILTHA